MSGRVDQLARAGEEALRRLAELHRAREDGLAACRACIQLCGRAIRAVHRQELDSYGRLVAEAEDGLRRAQSAAAPFPALAGSGLLHDAEKEYAEARLTSVLIAGALAMADAATGLAPDAGALAMADAATAPAPDGRLVPGSGGSGTSGPATSGPATSGPATSGPATSGPASSGPASSGPMISGPGILGPGTAPDLPDADALGVSVAAWLTGLAEAASELRRHLLDRLRAGELLRAQELLVAMEDVYDLLVTVDYPDAITGGLRRTTDALRAVLERSRADLTVTLVQARLQEALERRPVG